MTQSLSNELHHSFTRWRDWLKNWTVLHRDFKHVAVTNERFFYGNSSYMDLGELLRKNDGADSSPCVIYDTDIHTQGAQNDEGVYKIHTFYICVLSDDQIVGTDVTSAKDKCEEYAMQLMAWYKACKRIGNKNVVRGNMFSNIDSTTSFFNGWEAVKMTFTEFVSIPCFDETLYQ